MRLALPLLGLIAAGCLALAGWQAHGQRQARAELAARTPNTIDLRFAQFMALHHEQALLLAQLALVDPTDAVGKPIPRTTPSTVSGLAEGVRTQQLMELGEMRGWLKLWQAPSVPETRSMYWLLESKAPLDAETRQYLLDCQRAPTGMAGLAGNDQIQALRVARDRDRDALFLELMRRHHEGAIPMARVAAREASQPAVRDLAMRIVLEQQDEVMAIRMAQAQAQVQARPSTVLTDR